eukprot:m.110638 g.110638  ORF g.110638 m.110638 type:complete len:50 (+) comp13405_c0_seq2:836-985(+)
MHKLPFRTVFDHHTYLCPVRKMTPSFRTSSSSTGVGERQMPSDAGLTSL